MECYVHSAVSAVGICNTCGRGLCHDCALELEEWLVCVNCETVARRLLTLRNRTLFGQAGLLQYINYFVWPTFIVAIGIVQAYIGIDESSSGLLALGIIAIVIGTILGIWNYWSGRRRAR